MAEGNGAPRTFVIGAEDYRRLSLRDMIEASELSGVDSIDVENLRGAAQIRSLAALAFVITRRSEPDLTFDQVLDGRVEKRAEADAPLAAGSMTP